MHNLRVKEILKDRILVSRESARLLEDPLKAMMEHAGTPGETRDPMPPVTIDFLGIEGIAPSFLDELITLFESLLHSESNGRNRCLLIANPPTRLSQKFEAVARGHGMAVQALPDGSWLMTNAPESDRPD